MQFSLSRQAVSIRLEGACREKTAKNIGFIGEGKIPPGGTKRQRTTSVVPATAQNHAGIQP
jgi:hypothetical protein